MRMRPTSRFFNSFLILVTVIALAGITPPRAHAAEVRNIVFPVIGGVSYYDDFGAPRSGHSHEGNDLMGRKLMPLVAAVDGTVSWVQYPEPDWGYAISLRDADGYQYWYLHVNNDNPGTDDGVGGGLNAYAPDVINGATVVRGQLIGWMGDSGNAEGTGAHLHFEIHTPDGTPFSPYESLKAAPKLTVPVEAPQQPGEILPFGAFKGGASIAVGRFNNGATIAVAAGPGGGPHVKVMTADGALSAQFFPYPLSFKGGVDVAAGDVDGDGVDEIITGAGPGGGPHVRIFSASGHPIGQFFPYPSAFRGGVRVAAADIDNDGKAEIITSAGPGGGPHVRVFEANGSPVASFMAYAPTFRGGVDVAVKPATINAPARIVTSPLSNGGPHVRVFEVNGTLASEFFAYPAEFTGGVKVAVINTDSYGGTFSIVAVPASKGGPDIRIFSSQGVQTASRKAYEPWWRGGYEIAAAVNGTLYITSTGRRASIRTVSSSEFSQPNTNPNPNRRGRWWGRGD